MIFTRIFERVAPSINAHSSSSRDRVEDPSGATWRTGLGTEVREDEAQRVSRDRA